MKVAILRDSNPDSSLKWELACQKKGLQYHVVDMLRNDWLDEIRSFGPDFCVTRPPGDIQQNKDIFDDKLLFLEKNEGLLCFPGFHEISIYENKATLSYFLKTANIPHPETSVFYDNTEALYFIQETNYPLVAKTLIGAAGSGVKIIQDKKQATAYVNQAFKKGIRRTYGPNKNAGNTKSWLKKALNSPAFFLKKLRQYHQRYQQLQKDVVLFQQFIPHDFEWRCVKIGESYFAYKKLKVDGKSSGSKMFEYGAPPMEILDFTKELCERFTFNFMAVDLFYNEQGIFVNELQTIFGHKNPYICKVDDKLGRYIFTGNNWLFEEGEFNTNESYDLRLETAIQLFKSHKKESPV